MYQSFDAPASSHAAADHVARLRRLLAAARLDALLVPRADEHQGEYVPASAERLAWLTGFTGSAGLAVVGATSALLLVDGRYTVQAPRQVDTDIFEIQQAPPAKLSDWLLAQFGTGARIGYDPRLHTLDEIDALRSAIAPAGLKLAPTRGLVDRAWGRDRPPPPLGRVTPHPTRYAGQAADRKIAEVQKILAADKQDGVLLTLSDSIAWLFNIRGSDVAHNPVALAFAYVPATGRPEIFIAPAKLDARASEHLAKLADISPPEALPTRLAALKDARARVRVDTASAAIAFVSALGGPKAIARGRDPIIALKAIKNAVEIKGARAAHHRDGIAMVRFLAWLDREAPTGKLDEIAVVRQLETFRRDTGALKEISFDTICGAGPNGAIVHYRVTDATTRRIATGELLLVDSGAQYLDGTTDITRTMAIGRPTAEMKARFTLVLKGHIAIATTRFPKGTRGIDLDPFARRALWAHGLEYDHGTGHGVGSYLAVHEGPQSISRRGMATLEPGMIVSNEPGYYKADAYGIRIENLVLVTPPETIEGADRETLAFETLTLCPIDRRLIVPDLLAPEERRWLDAYHARVRSELGPDLAPADRKWLDAATARL